MHCAINGRGLNRSDTETAVAPSAPERASRIAMLQRRIASRCAGVRAGVGARAFSGYEGKTVAPGQGLRGKNSRIAWMVEVHI